MFQWKCSSDVLFQEKYFLFVWNLFTGIIMFQFIFVGTKYFSSKAVKEWNWTRPSVCDRRNIYLLETVSLLSHLGVSVGVFVRGTKHGKTKQTWWNIKSCHVLEELMFHFWKVNQFIFPVTSEAFIFIHS